MINTKFYLNMSSMFSIYIFLNIKVSSMRTHDFYYKHISDKSFLRQP